MKKYIIGAVVGFFSLPLVLAIALFAYAGIQPFYALYYSSTAESLPKELEAYREGAYSYFTDYELEAPFLDEDSETTHSRDLFIFREEPVIELYKGDYDSVCIQSFDNSTFNVALVLSPDAREILQNSFAQRGEPFDDTFAAGGYRKRYFVEAGGSRITWFWVSGRGADAYRDAVAVAPEDPDFILSVPLGQLYNFQFYLINGMTDAPLKGCTPDVVPELLPAWNTLVIPFWDDSLSKRQ